MARTYSRVRICDDDALKGEEGGREGEADEAGEACEAVEMSDTGEESDRKRADGWIRWERWIQRVVMSRWREHLSLSQILEGVLFRDMTY